MLNTDPRIDAYILKSAEFAQEILNYIRMIVHTTCPECQETMKWSFPHFLYKGEILCSMAAFKQHCAFGFWKEKLMTNSSNLLTDKGKTAMGDFGKITSLKDLPSKSILKKCIKEAMMLNEQGIKIPKTVKKIPDEAIVVPEQFLKALNANPIAKKNFNAFSNSHKREYINYILEAKREETRIKRIQKSIELLAQAKSHLHKYEA
ncbi:MAG: YdeI/OmpD-associated family protein [Saprospiraceae bacterium]|nr:YdeI/OmpD-associated family protein [Saprospiraceae bacterium]